MANSPEENKIADLEKKLDAVCKLINSAKVRIRTAQAIEHLKLHDVGALSNNIPARLHECYTHAIVDLDKAEVIADIIPF